MFGRVLTNVAGVQARHMSAISGPPTVKMSVAEKTIHGLVICVGCMAIPTWVLVNMKHYKQSK